MGVFDEPERRVEPPPSNPCRFCVSVRFLGVPRAFGACQRLLKKENCRIVGRFCACPRIRGGVWADWGWRGWTVPDFFKPTARGVAGTSPGVVTALGGFKQTPGIAEMALPCRAFGCWHPGGADSATTNAIFVMNASS